MKVLPALLGPPVLMELKGPPALPALPALPVPLALPALPALPVPPVPLVLMEHPERRLL